MLQARGISKSFGGSQALADVSADVAPGEVVALVGENGAGKSTLLKVLAAVVRRDAGEVTIDARPYDPRSQREAEAAGVALVFQELNVNMALSIAENVMLGHLRDFRCFGILDGRALKAAAQAILDRIGAEFTVDDPVDSLDLGQIKTVEVARALALNPRYVFFDESTAFLNRDEAARLLDVIAELRRQGLGIAMVSHHLAELFAISDRMVVLKDGALVGAYDTDGMDEERLTELMVGRDMSGGMFPASRPTAVGDPAIEASGVTTRAMSGPLDLTLKRGEILGIGGLKGSGGEAIVAALAGQDPLSGGEIRLHGAPYRPRLPRDGWARGIATLPGDRTGEGVVTDFSVLENLTLATRPRRMGIVSDRRAMRQSADEQVASLGIRAQSVEMTTGDLSGGNMQKVVLGKCLAARPRVLLLNNPTRGVDVGARSEIYRVIRRLADDGMAVLMVTEDLHELIGLSDRVIVTRMGAISHRFAPGAELTEEEIVKWMM
ncbi:sugar ABC transporter ATP-binding protein [Oceaniglobus indicus]|uniref:sugar ABC transporter ATP-binding protein n=1 Tax=Oceaniglobus indicus TaxID=2047749 RepID=UPI000C19FCC6|nr:sugar ABC transporter ATP-binding protein [Oceaniglobus indicus]